MREGTPPYETLVLVCTNRRAEGARISCAGEGRCGGALRDALKEEVARRGLKSSVRVSASGCLDLCEEGPSVLIVDGRGKKTCLGGAAVADLPAILDHIAGKRTTTP